MDPSSVAALVEAVLLMLGALLGRNELRRQLSELSRVLSARHPASPAAPPMESLGEAHTHTQIFKRGLASLG